ncbi:hypothetical protein A4H97_22270 [Niastella yeongjuensis]|uniref:Uncharacterized protein n=1 Tax=Niastella yeongjuensis TaxID=354355 RepID=A0A1V9F7N1_9BACT|nr:hypothetical protein A4H97_22270 [Niastella yeongjuensis]
MMLPTNHLGPLQFSPKMPDSFLYQYPFLFRFLLINFRPGSFVAVITKLNNECIRNVQVKKKENLFY